MKRQIFFIFLFFNIFIFAQDRPCGLKNGLQEGTCKIYFESGALRRITNWKEGKRDGVYQEFFENGKMKMSGFYKKEFRTKTWSFYTEAGIKEADETYDFKDQGINYQKGYSVDYYPSGVVKKKGVFINGNSEGKWLTYHENGKLQSEGFMLKGERDGERKEYDTNGKLIKTEKYKAGKLLK